MFFELTVESGRLCTSRFAEFHERAEQLLDRPILTHELADDETWLELKARLEAHRA